MKAKRVYDTPTAYVFIMAVDEAFLTASPQAALPSVVEEEILDEYDEEIIY